MSLKQICNAIVIRNIRFQYAFAKRLYATEKQNEIVDITTADEKPIYSEFDSPELQEEIKQKRNKSRLHPGHRNILMGVRPYDAPMEWYHNTVRYKKRTLGRYGLAAAEVPAGFAWPTPKEVEDAQEYERVSFPLSLQERWQKLKEAREKKAALFKEREERVSEKLSKLDQWMAEVNAKVAKKEAALEQARLRKERLVEEVRRHFGFKISPHDDRFKEMLEKKEKEEKKKKKEAKKQERLQRLANKYEEESKNTDSTEPIDSTKSMK